MTHQRAKTSRSVRLGACVAVALLATGGCRASARDQIFDACEHSVKNRVKPKPVTFSLERVTIGKIPNRATMWGSAKVGSAKRQTFRCIAVHRHGRWETENLFGVNR